MINFNYQFGVITTPDLNVISSTLPLKDTKLLDFCLKLIHEEHRELTEAIEQDDMIETIDAILDLLFVIYGFCCRVGIDIDKEYSTRYNK